MEDPFPSSLSSSLLDHYATSGCTFADMLDYSDKSSSLGFMELLEFGDSAPEHHFTLPDRKESSEVLNAPPTPNYSSISSKSSNALKDEYVKDEEDEEEEVDDHKKKTTTKKQLKVKKTNEKKKKREERFAFMTKRFVFSV